VPDRFGIRKKTAKVMKSTTSRTTIVQTRRRAI